MTFPPCHHEPPAAPRCAARLVALLATVGVVTLGGCGAGEPKSAPPVTAAAPVPTAPIVAPAPRPTGPLAPGTSCSTAGCHGSFTDLRVVHGALRAADACSACHEADQGGHVYPLKRPGNQGCVFCHEGVIGDRMHQHQAAALDCTACHDPHATKHRALLREAMPALCANCHPVDSMTSSHPPFANGECAACHEPHESDFPHLLRGGEGPEHCFLCHRETHDAIASAQWVHPPAGEDCLTCHRAHGSQFPHALAQPIEKGCFACHSDIERLVAGASAPHGALALNDRCANCHDAHAANHEHMLKDRQDVLCLKCHDKPILATDGRSIPDMTPSIRDREFLHGPVRSGDCSACHNVHGSSHSRLLAGQFTESFYASFDIAQYALCFECHATELVTTERTDALTNFRDGDVNLHYLHVNRQEKGRTCRACHEIHGSNLPAHIAESVPFGDAGWALPIGFEKTTTGGGCAPGCHKPMGYDRGSLSIPDEPGTNERGE